jgi:hypothetical protein
MVPMAFALVAMWFVRTVYVRVGRIEAALEAQAPERSSFDKEELVRDVNAIRFLVVAGWALVVLKIAFESYRFFVLGITD